MYMHAGGVLLVTAVIQVALGPEKLLNTILITL